jgi:hypothetical protein
LEFEVPLTCRRCSRTNPEDAHYCHFDGLALDVDAGQAGPLDVGKQPFPSSFVFPSGESCRNFDQLALTCNRNWKEARELIQEGFLAGFLGGIGRVDLAMAAREAAKHADLDQGLDDFLSKLPSDELAEPKLRVEPGEINLGQLKVGQDIQTEIHLSNEGMRLLRGSAVVKGGEWLQLGEGAAAKMFQFTDTLRVPLQVRGKALRASNKPLEGTIVVDTTGGKETITVRAQVPVVAFGEGVLAGSRTPREAATKAKAAPKEAAPLFESGAVARWYESNGWTYPVLGPASTGLGAVQQFFEALGLVQPPKVEINTTNISLSGRAGERVQSSVKVTALEPRPVYAHGSSDQPWLSIGKVTLTGKMASVPLIVETIPDQPGETLQATVTVTANGQQRFTVAVGLAVGGTQRSGSAVDIQVLETIEAVPVPVLDTIPEDPPAVKGLPLFARLDPGGWPAWMHAVPLAIICLLLLIVITRDFFAKGVAAPLPPDLIDEPEPPPDRHPRIGVLFHDRPDTLLDERTQRFGLVMLREKDPNDRRKLKKLTFHELGTSNNTCLKIDNKEMLFGHKPGTWEVAGGALTGKNDHGEDRIGERSVWLTPDRMLAVTQQVEIITGEQTKLVDTCLVRYTITNRDRKAHTVGLRFMLDTYIGANDGVPFTIPGDKRLCDTFLRFDNPAKMPDFIQALERQDLANPGTVAHLQLKLGGKMEPPTRLTLGCWPDAVLAKEHKTPTALAQLTMWNVPVLPIHTLSPGDSAVTMYWDPRPLASGATRELGFSYGLGAIATSGAAKGKLALTVGGSFRPGGEFTVTAYVSNPAPGQTLKLDLPDGFSLVDSDPEQPVPTLPPDAERRTSPVTWKVRSANKAGTHTLKVTSSTGLTQTQRVTIQSNRLFD